MQMHNHITLMRRTVIIVNIGIRIVNIGIRIVNIGIIFQCLYHTAGPAVLGGQCTHYTMCNTLYLAEQYVQNGDITQVQSMTLLIPKVMQMPNRNQSMRRMKMLIEIFTEIFTQIFTSNFHL